MCFYKQKSAYELRIRVWSSDVCSSDLVLFDATVPPFSSTCASLVADTTLDKSPVPRPGAVLLMSTPCVITDVPSPVAKILVLSPTVPAFATEPPLKLTCPPSAAASAYFPLFVSMRSEEHTSELQSLMRNSYADFC